MSIFTHMPVLSVTVGKSETSSESALHWESTPTTLVPAAHFLSTSSFSLDVKDVQCHDVQSGRELRGLA